MLRHSAFKYTVLFAAALSATTVEAVTSSDLQQMEKKVQEQSMEHKKLQAQATQINLELTAVSQEMVKAARLIQNNEEKLSHMERQLEKLKTELADAEAGFLQEDDNLIRTLAALQNLALKPTEALLVQPLTPVEIIRSAMLLRETVPFLEENAARIRKDLDAIARKKQQVEKQYAEISKQKQVLEYEHDQMKKLVQKKSKIRNTVEIKSEQAKKNVDKLAAQANDLRDLLGKLEKQRQEKLKREAEERRRIEQKAAEERRLAQKNLTKKQSDDLIKSTTQVITNKIEGFAQAKGSLSMPARGKIITAYGEQLVKGVTAKGITIRTRNQAQVVAPFDGSVIFSGPFRGYGNLIIIEHGDGYLSLLAGLQDMSVEVGQMLLAGEPIGQMPEDGDAKLYLEIRKDNHPLDPLAWLKV